MIRAIQITAVGLMLSVAALCVFGCFGIREFMKSATVLTADSDAALKAATAAENKAAAVADNLNAAIDETKPQIAETLKGVNETVAQLKNASAGLSVSVAELNAPCVPGPCGTIADVAKTLNTFRMTAGKLEIAANHEDQRLAVLDAQEQQLADDSHADLAKLGGAIDGINALATNKDLTGSLAHTNVALGAVAGMATDTQQMWHNTLHPKWPRRVWNAVTGVGISVAKFFVP